MTFKVGNYDPNAAKRAAIEAAKARASAKFAEAALVKYTPPAECVERSRIIFDDSSSMGSQLENAKRGVIEYLKNCIPNQTAVAVHFMNTTSWNTTLRSDLPQLAQDIKETELRSGGTPFFNTIKKALEATPRATRLVAFTDGAPTDKLQAEGEAEIQSIWNRSDTWRSSADVVIKISKFQAPAIPIDCVFFGNAEWSTREVDLLKYLAESTGGFFMVFDPAKMDFATGMKYLAPVNRLRLTDGSFRAALERGEVK